MSALSIALGNFQAAFNASPINQAVAASTASALRSALVAESDSWNSFVKTQQDGLPALFDAAMLPLFLGDEAKLGEWQNLILNYQPPPIFARIKGAFFCPVSYVPNLYGQPLIDSANSLIALEANSIATFGWTYP